MAREKALFDLLIDKLSSERMTSKALLILAAIVEVATGLVLVSQPALFVRLLFGVEMSGAGLALGRLAGFGLFSLGLACWSLRTPTLAALRAMLIYNFLGDGLPRIPALRE
jgi:hypothetical protein